MKIPGSLAGFFGLWFLWFGRRTRRRLVPRYFFQYLIEVRRVFIAAQLAGGIDEGLRLFRRGDLLRRFRHVLIRHSYLKGPGTRIKAMELCLRLWL